MKVKVSNIGGCCWKGVIEYYVKSANESESSGDVAGKESKNIRLKVQVKVKMALMDPWMVLEGGKGVPDYSVKSSEEKSEDKTSESESKSESESFKLDNLNVVQSES